ncbi:zinc finger MYM-type protein 1-like [Acyrthosiphon pisum]|uniref:HAT C-terminal dimerisation domain-containing protein n=1 Tax=Acyrthosiphon pisum TaxID=7029 RepID=A0A8R2B842_ACYPI|nr:zinc finger MYM-type protein 1-like [Acyrthosiphon pisum]|eukprot:XP_008185833.1 PREDICTED: zinc finger MYM-type protein 1-like [Acyrthosiphon pisum]
MDEDPEHKFILREDFLKFVSVENTTGKNVSNVILDCISSLGINPKYMVGQGYDGAAAMSGHFKGVQTIIRKEYPAALYVHCSAHSLNLALSHSCSIQHIRNCIGTIKSVGNFIKSSATRTEMLKKYIKEQFPESKWTKLTSMCETRWVENHDGLIRFTEIYKAIVNTLEELQSTRDIETSSKALQLGKTIITSDFVISMVSASTLFSLTLPLCKNLQSVNCDLTEAMEYVDTVLHEIKDMRGNMNNTFSKIFKKTDALIKSIDSEEVIKIPRIVGRQKNRSNIVMDSPEEYYRVTIAIPFFDDFIEQLQTRFNNHKNIISSLHKLLPKMCNTFEIDLNDFEIYSAFVDLEVLPQEINLWKRKWTEKVDKDLPNSAIEAYVKCNYEYFPNISFLLKILATLPVSTATPERSFSTLKRLKNFLRNSSGQERLTGLALLSEQTY